MNQRLQTAPSPSIAGGAVALPASSYYRRIVPLAMAMLMVIGARMHDGVPFISKIRPAFMLALVGGGMALLKTNRAVLSRAALNPMFQSQLLYFGWATLGVPFAIWIGGALTSLQAFLPALALTFIALLCPPTLSVVERLQRGLVLGCVGTAINAKVLGYVTSEGRLTTSGSLDSNDLAAVMTLAFALALGLVARERGTMRKLFWAVCGGLLVFILMKAGSRGGMIAIMVSTVVFVAGQRGSRRPIFAVICLIGGIAAWSTASKGFQKKMQALFRGEQDYNYTEYSGRKAVWARARGYTLAHPVFGVGIGNFPIAEGESCAHDHPDQGCKWSATHNSYLQASAELGLPGVTIFVAMLVRGCLAALGLWKVPRAGRDHHRPELLAAILGFMASATFLSHAYFYLLFGLLGLVAFAAMVEREARAGLPARAPAGPAPRRVAALRPVWQPMNGARPGAPRHATGMAASALAPVPHGVLRRSGPDGH